MGGQDFGGTAVWPWGVDVVAILVVASVDHKSVGKVISNFVPTNHTKLMTSNPEMDRESPVNDHGKISCNLTLKLAMQSKCEILSKLVKIANLL